jgi:2,5-dioxopentanoate dehydrogenase
MEITGHLLIGSRSQFGSGGEFQGINAASGEPIEPVFGGASPNEVDEACRLAEAAFDTYRETGLDTRAHFLEQIASNILDMGEALIDRCAMETGLPRARIQGERDRTVNQLHLFAGVVRSGSLLGLRIDPAQSTRKPIPRPDLRLRQVPLGPIAVFGASNFPLAFSVAGGDTASALAVGCPVVVKAHSAHPGTSELVGRAVQVAGRDSGLPEGVFSLLFDSGFAVGQRLVSDSRVKAVGFTGSRAGGTALMAIAAARLEPIPVYAEMSSINPVLLLPGALSRRDSEIARSFVESLMMGAGQLCTNPGLIVALEGNDLAEFTRDVADLLMSAPAGTMLTPGIHRNYCAGISRLASHPLVEKVAMGCSGDKYQGQAALFQTMAESFLSHPELHEEVFGASALIVRCRDEQELEAVARSFEGQLTIALHIDPEDYAFVRRLLPMLEKKCGRLVVNAFGTGVEVGHAMVHGGPYPATSDGRSTSVGSLAAARFLRPICYQGFPEDLLPPALRDTGPTSLPKHIDGKYTIAHQQPPENAST